MKIQANTIRGGMVIEHNGRRYTVIKSDLRTAGNWRSFIQVEMRDIASGNKTNERFSTSDTVEKLTVEERAAQFLFKDGDMLTFMFTDDYEQVSVPADMMGEMGAFLNDGMQVTIHFIEGVPVSVGLPAKVVLEVAETEPSIKGQTATNSYKPAVLSNGLRTTVPPFISTGEKIVINTSDVSYVERAKKDA